jgi:predicted DNA-binding transcriptional regulator YafY
LWPLGLIYLWDKKQWYVVAINKENEGVTDFRADRFAKVELGEESFRRPEGFDLKEYMAAKWGISGDSESKIQVCFRNTGWHNTAMDKLKGDVSRRRVYCRDCELRERFDGSLLLKDKVAGLREFAAWLRSYGDAAEVLEPAALRRKMRKTAAKMLERYGVGGAAASE